MAKKQQKESQAKPISGYKYSRINFKLTKSQIESLDDDDCWFCDTVCMYAKRFDETNGWDATVDEIDPHKNGLYVDAASEDYPWHFSYFQDGKEILSYF